MPSDHHHPDRRHGHHHRFFRRSHQFPEPVVGVLGRLLDHADDFGNLVDLSQHLNKREPGELKHLDAAVAELESARKEATPRNVLRIMADNKALEFFQRDKEAVLRGLNGNGPLVGDAKHALILPVPPHRFHLLEDISPGMLYLLPGHHVPHELDEYDVADLPTRSRTVRAELSGLQSVTFEAYIDRSDSVLTRREIIDLLSDLVDNGVKPLLRIVTMPQLPHHEHFEPIEKGYQIETFA